MVWKSKLSKFNTCGLFYVTEMAHLSKIKWHELFIWTKELRSVELSFLKKNQSISQFIETFTFFGQNVAGIVCLPGNRVQLSTLTEKKKLFLSRLIKWIDFCVYNCWLKLTFKLVISLLCQRKSVQWSMNNFQVPRITYLNYIKT